MARDFNGYTPMLKAASLGRESVVKKLIDAGVPVNHCDSFGQNVIDKVEL